MCKSTKKYLRQNPFTAYRDPETGQWLVIPNSQLVSKKNSEGSDSVSA